MCWRYARTGLVCQASLELRPRADQVWRSPSVSGERPGAGRVCSAVRVQAQFSWTLCCLETSAFQNFLSQKGSLLRRAEGNDSAVQGAGRKSRHDRLRPPARPSQARLLLCDPGLKILVLCRLNGALFRDQSLHFSNW